MTLAHQPGHTDLIRMIDQSLRDAGVDQKGSEFRVPQDMRKDVDWLRVIGQMRRLRGRAFQIQQALERHRPIGAVHGLHLDRPGRIGEQFVHRGNAGRFAEL